jgi:hypothetical protein
MVLQDVLYDAVTEIAAKCDSADAHFSSHKDRTKTHPGN